MLLLPKLAECLIFLILIRTSALLSTSAREDALITPKDGLKRSLVDVLRTRSNDGTDPFFGIPKNV